MLFGSGARDALRAHSDIDVGVVPRDPDLPLSAELDPQTRLERVCGRPVDLVRLDRASTLLRWEAARTGVLVLAPPRRVRAIPSERGARARGPADSAEARRRALPAAGGRSHSPLDRLARRPLTDPVLVLRKLANRREHVARARRRHPDAADVLRGDVDLQDALAMSVLVAIQEAIDVAFHIVADEAWGLPASYAEGFEILARRGALDAGLAAELARAVAVRHRIAHGYATPDLDRFWKEIPAGLRALDAFATAVARFLPPGAC